jgi:hypothetical protein
VGAVIARCHLSDLGPLQHLLQALSFELIDWTIFQATVDGAITIRVVFAAR